MWIDPMTISCALDGRPFKPYHATPAGLAAMGHRIINEQGDPGGLARLFGDPRAGHSGIVLWSVPGPLGPVRPISVNGLHRSVVLQSLKLPVVLAEMRQWEPPYRFRVRPDGDWDAVWAFFERLDAQSAIRLSRRPIVEISVGGESFGRDIRVADAPAPWLLGDESRVRTALAAYEELKGRRVRRIGRMDADDLRFPPRRRVG